MSRPDTKMTRSLTTGGVIVFAILVVLLVVLLMVLLMVLAGF